MQPTSQEPVLEDAKQEEDDTPSWLLSAEEELRAATPLVLHEQRNGARASAPPTPLLERSIDEDAPTGSRNSTPPIDQPPLGASENWNVLWGRPQPPPPRTPPPPNQPRRAVPGLVGARSRATTTVLQGRSTPKRPRGRVLLR